MVWVLIVDDDPDIRETLQDVLHGAGYAIAEVADGADALDVLRATPYGAVVLLDLFMPGMDGRTVLEVLQQDRALATRHAYILMSANHQALNQLSSTVVREMNTATLRKPFNVGDLLDTIAALAARLPRRED